MTVDRYMGIDPGDRWIGWCKLRITDGDKFVASMGVYDRVPIAYTATIDRLVPTAPTTVVCESFQNRPMGYNRFSSMETPQLIGALKYTVMKANHMWAEVGPGNPDNDLLKYPIGRYVEHWMTLCPEPRDTRWRHARAAWRVLSYYLTQMHVHNHFKLKKPRKLPRISLADTQGIASLDLIAPSIVWTLSGAI